MTPGLTGVPTAELERLLRLIHREQLACPFSAQDLHLAAFANVAGHLAPVTGLDRRATLAVLTAVIAERRACERRLAVAPGARRP